MGGWLDGLYAGLHQWGKAAVHIPFVTESQESLFISYVAQVSKPK